MGADRGLTGPASAEAFLYLLPIVLFVLLFALVPVSLLFAKGWLTGGGLDGFVATVWQNPNNRIAWTNSLEQGGLSAAFATLFGYPAGIFLARYSWPGRSTLRGFLLLPFLLPSIVVVVGILDLFGPSGIFSQTWPALGWLGGGVPGIVAANLLFNVPLVVLFTALGCESASGALEETALSLGAPPRRAYRDVWAGPSLVGATVGAVLTFIFSALAFASPILICGPRCYTLEAQVWALSSSIPSAPANLLALGVLVFLVLPIVGYVLLAGRLRASPGAGARRPQPVRQGGKLALGLGVEALVVFVAIGVVLGGVLYRSVVPIGSEPWGAGWSDLFAARTTAFLGISAPAVVGNTLGFALFAAVVALVLVLFATLGLRLMSRWEGPVTSYLFLPLLISPVLLAFSLAQFWRPVLGGEPTVWILIGVAQATLALPFALQSLEIPIVGLSPAAMESARTLGASRWTAFWDADVPRLRTGLLTATLFAFALGLGEFTATYFLFTPTYTTLSVAVYRLEALRFSQASSGAAALLLLLSVVLFLIVIALGRSRRDEA